MNMLNIVTFYLVTISDTTNELLSGDNRDLLNCIELNRMTSSLYRSGGYNPEQRLGGTT